MIGICKFIKKVYLKLSKSLKYRLLIFVSLIIILPMILTGTYLYLKLYRNMVDTANKDINLFMEQTNENVKSQLKRVEDINNLIINNKVITEEISDESIDNDEFLSVMSKIKIDEQLKYCSLFRYSSAFHYSQETDLIKSIYLYKNENKFYKVSSGDGYYRELESDEINKAVFNISNSIGDSNIVIPPNNEKNIMYFTSSIKNIYTSKDKGKVILGVDENMISDMYRNIAESYDANWFLINSSGDILSSKDKDLIGTSIEKVSGFENNEGLKYIDKSKEYYINRLNEVGRFGVSSIILVEKKQIIYAAIQPFIGYTATISIIMLVAFIAGIYIYRSIMATLNDLAGGIKLVGSGDYNAKMPVYPYSELNEITNVFNNMSSEINYLVNDVYQKQILLRESELKLLHSQINPHFMFNVLLTIEWEARMSNNENIYKMVNSFSKLMRANISLKNREKILIKEELKYIDFYLYLQQIRFKDKFRYKINIEDEELVECYIPKLSVQAVIENAAVHGLEKKVGDGSIIVNLKKYGDSIIFEVVDDGVGFDTKDVDINFEREASNDKHTHIGLFNSNKRIKLFYGDDYGITIESEVNKGSRVTIKIPIDKRSD